MKRSLKLKLRAVLLGVVAATLFAGAAAPQRAQVLLDPDDVLGLRETARLEIRVEGGSAMPEPDFQLENFRIVGGPTQSTSLRIVNGRQSASRSISWQLQPRGLGRARVHSIRVRFDGRRMKLDDCEVLVIEEAPTDRRRRSSAASRPVDPLLSEDPFERLFDSVGRPGRRPTRGTEPPRIFLRAEVTPRNPFAGEQVIYTLNLYTQVSIHSVTPENFPEFKGFWAQVIPQPEQLRPKMVTYEGERFGRVVLLERALFPRRAGTFKLEAVSARMVARIPDSGPYASMMPRSREIVRRSNPVTLKVRDLPEAPPDWTGAVGQMRLTAELEPPELALGEAATLTLRLEGKGHLRGIPVPPIPELAGVEVFPPQQQSSDELKGKRVYGSRTWSYVLMPERVGEWRLGPIELPFFDPAARKFRVAATAALELAVHGRSRALADGETELHPIRTAALPAVGGEVSMADFRPWLFALPWGIAVLLLVLSRRRGAGYGPARRRLLAALDEAVYEERPRQAAALVETGWRDFLLERWEIHEGSPSTQWAELLVERGVDRDSAEALVKLADDVHYLRYAPKLSSIDELRAEILSRSRKLVRAVG